MAQHKSAAEIQAWLIEELSKYLKLPAAEIDPQQPFAAYGADSLTLITMGGDLEEWLDRHLSPTLPWKYPTISQLSTYLAENPEDEST